MDQIPQNGEDRPQLRATLNQESTEFGGDIDDQNKWLGRLGGSVG